MKAKDTKSQLRQSLVAEARLPVIHRETPEPIHPGEILLEEFLKPFGVSQYELAKVIGVSPRRINEIVHGKRAITPDTALRFSRAFNVSDRFWLNLQNRYDLEIEKTRLAEPLAAIRQLKVAI